MKIKTFSGSQLGYIQFRFPKLSIAFKFYALRWWHWIFLPTRLYDGFLIELPTMEIQVRKKYGYED